MKRRRRILIHIIPSVWLEKSNNCLKISDDSARVIVEPLARAEITQLHLSDEFDSADVVCKQYAIEENGGVRGEALVLDVLNRAGLVCAFSA